MKTGLIYIVLPVLLINLSINTIAQKSSVNQPAIKEEKFITIQPVNRSRVQEIAAMLPGKPRGIGQPHSDRASWNALLKSGKFDTLIATANKASAVPLPAMTDEIYLSFFNSNDSETSKRHRDKNCSLEVIDEVDSDTAKTFETSLVTRASWNQVAPDKIELLAGMEKMLVTITVPGRSGFTINSEVITETPIPYTRIGIKLNDPIQRGEVRMLFSTAVK